MQPSWRQPGGACFGHGRQAAPAQAAGGQEQAQVSG